MSQFDRIYKNISSLNERVLRGACVVTSTMMVSQTPVRDGYLKSSWNFAVGRMDSTLHGSGRDALPPLQAAANDFKLGQVAYFINAQPYAVKMEYGGSDQAPAGMVRPVLAQWQWINEQVIKGLT